MTQPARSYVVDPDDPRAPPQEIWDRLSPEERESIIRSLPSEFPVSEASPPEGDAHFEAKVGARLVLRDYFARIGRKIYLGSELPIYYPGENMFAPDVLAVTDVEPHPRERWVVAAEGKGLDLAMEIHVAGDRRKDLERNVQRYARLGIREYFIFDRGRMRLIGYRLPDGELARKYQPIVPQAGLYSSQVLGLDMRLEDDKLRFFHAMAPLPEADELISSLEVMVDRVQLRLENEERQRQELEQRLEEETRKREEETRMREEETRKREEAETRLADALAELARLRGDS